MSNYPSFSSIDDPTPRDAANKIINGLESGSVVTINGYCTVDYTGRAESDEPAEGVFVVLLKPDGTALVHSSEKFKPMNWQTPGAEITPRLSDKGDLRIRVESDEFLEILFSDVFHLTAVQASDSSELDLIGTEEDMHNKLIAQPHLIESGIGPLEHEKKFEFGRVDLFGEDSAGRPVIIEVKRRDITRDHINQLYTYMMDYTDLFDEEPRGIIAGPDCSEYMQSVMEGYGIEFVQITPL